MDDAELLRRAQIKRGDESAFCALFGRYQRRIYQYALRMCGGTAGDDVVQETFMTVLRARGFESSKGAVAQYLFGVARHHVMRRLAALDAASIDQADTPFENIAAPEETPIETMTREQTIAAARRCTVFCRFSTVR